jgi:tryptophan synthase alpha chain
MPTERITAAFDRAKADKRAVLVSYLMAGDPDLETSYEALCALRDNGADIIELGAPFTDPMADGPAIQRAGLRALAAKTKLTDVLALIARFRESDQTTPIIIMGYANPVHSMAMALLRKRPTRRVSMARSSWTCHRKKMVRCGKNTQNTASR